MAPPGALALIGGLDDDFLVMNGDVLTDLEYRRLFDDHCNSDASGDDRDAEPGGSDLAWRPAAAKTKPTRRA